MKPPPSPLPPTTYHADGAITLALPYPPTAITPNARRGESRWAAIAKSKAVKRHREIATVTMRAAMHQMLSTDVFTGYSLAHFFPTMAFRDDDNADGSCKAYRDGIATALGMDDKKLKKCLLSTFAKDAGCPRVEITLHI